jgi:hypothetical protein
VARTQKSFNIVILVYAMLADNVDLGGVSGAYTESGPTGDVVALPIIAYAIGPAYNVRVLRTISSMKQ